MKYESPIYLNFLYYLLISIYLYLACNLATYSCKYHVRTLERHFKICYLVNYEHNIS